MKIKNKMELELQVSRVGDVAHLGGSLEAENTVAPPYLRFHFPWFQSPKVNYSPKILNGKFQK